MQVVQVVQEKVQLVLVLGRIAGLVSSCILVGRLQEEPVAWPRTHVGRASG